MKLSIDVFQQSQSASECLKSIAVEKFHYDVIVLDTYLKDMPCSELAQRIRNIIPEQRIIFTTTSSLNQIRSRLSSMGMVDQNIVQKPFRLSQLLSAIYALKMP